VFALKQKVSFAFRRSEPEPIDDVRAPALEADEPMHLPRPVEDRNLDGTLDHMLERYPRTLENLAA